MAPSSVAGNMAPVDFAGLSIPVVAGMKFSAVGEVHSSAIDVEDDTSVVRASEQRSEGSLDPRKSPGMVDRPTMEPSAPEPLEHSVLDEDLDGRPMEGLSIPEPLEHSVLDVDLDGRPREGLSVPEPLEHSVRDEDLDGRPRERLSVPEPLEHSVLVEDLDSRPVKGLSVPEPLEHSVLVEYMDGGPMEGLSIPEPLEIKSNQIKSNSTLLRIIVYNNISKIVIKNTCNIYA